MPTIQEINQKRRAQAPIEQKFSNFKTNFKIVVFVLVLVLTFMYIMPKKIITIPDEIYATSNKGYFKELFETSHKKVIWFSADCPVSKRRNDLINMLMKEFELEKYYEHRPFLQSYLDIKFTDTMGRFIMQHCSSGYCIIDPLLHKIAKVDEKSLIRDMLKYLDNTNW